MRTVIIAAVFALLCSCETQDTNYAALHRLDANPKARLVLFETYPLQERFRLYNKIYEKSGHPHDAELSTGFRDQPENAMDFIIDDLKDSKFTDYLRYLPVFYDLGKQTDLDICREDRIGALKAALDRYRLSHEQLEAIKGLRFKGCELP